MYNKLSVGIDPAYLLFIACLGCEVSYFQSPAVLSKTARILGKYSGGCILFTKQIEPMSHSEYKNMAKSLM
jgi:hypothetical protein